MKIVIYESSSGFAPYTTTLCKSIEKYLKITDRLLYISDKKNMYQQTDFIKIEKKFVLDVFEVDNKKYKKGTIRWLYNRVNISLKNLKIGKKIIQSYNPDVLLLETVVPVFDQFLMKKIKKNIKIITLVHDVIIPSKSFAWSKKSLKSIYQNSDQLIVHSETNKRQLNELYSIPLSKIKVIHHGILPEFKVLKQEKCKAEIGVDNNNPTLLFYGSIRESKGLDILLKALNNIQCNLIIAGAMPYGETFAPYEKIIKENHLSCYKYIERTSDEFRDILFQASDIVVLPYKFFYSQSGVFSQAIQYHKPIIATDVSSFKEFIERYHIGKVCQQNSIDDLHEKIVEMISDTKKLKIYENNAINAVKDNTWEKSAEAFYQIFNSLTKRGN